MQTGWLTQTKFIPPRLHEDFVARNRLLDTLRIAVSTHPLTLISAPPGYGKTTLLASLPSATPGLSIVWISLEDEDNDPARFLASLVRALQQANPDYGRNTQTLLASLTNPAGETRRVISSLINETLENLPETWIILDDLHLITEPVVHATLDYFLERMPAQMHLLIATRHDPPLSLARLRARGQLAELRLPDMRFTKDEVRLFLNEKLCLNLSTDDLTKLQTRAEGWAAGLRLLAGSLDQIASANGRTAFIQDLALTDRYVFDFLAEEVLKRQEPETRAFLLETSILPELTPVLCAAVTGRRDAQSVLESLYRHNLFLVQAGGAGKTFRYHALFAEFLQEQLQQEMPDRIAELHKRAADVQKATAPEHSIIHFLAAELWDDAALTIEQVSENFIRQGLFHTLSSWIGALPDSVREDHPRLLYILGLEALQRGDLTQAMAFLESARRGCADNGDTNGQGEALLLMIDTASRQHEYAQQAALTRQALTFPLPIHGQVQLLMAQVWQSIFQPDAKQADEALDKAIDLTQSSNDLRAFNLMAPILNMHLAFLPSGTARLQRYCREVLSRFGNESSSILACAHSLLGYILFLQGALAESVREEEQSKVILEQIGGLAYTVLQTCYVLGVSRAVGCKYAIVEQSWEQILTYVEQTSSTHPYFVTALYFIGRAQWLQGKYDQARQIVTRIAAISDQGEFPETMVTRQLMHALIEISDHKYDDAERTLFQALPFEQRWAHAAMFGSPRVLLAYLHLQQKHEKEAWSQFALFLAECEKRNRPGLILQESAIAVPLLRLAIERKSHADFAKRMLDELDVSQKPEPVTIPETGQTLTARELEVLKLIIYGDSNQAIAKQLVISEHTVKVHITNIFSKLQVTSRTQAAARACELHLV